MHQATIILRHNLSGRIRIVSPVHHYLKHLFNNEIYLFLLSKTTD